MATKKVCKYWPECYQKNEKHKNAYAHPPVENKVKSKVEDTEEPIESDRKRLKLDEADQVKSVGKDITEVQQSKESKKTCSKDEEKSEEPAIVIPSLDTMKAKKQFIKERFLVEMPQDFYDLWSIAESFNPENPREAFQSAGFTLVGPYDILAGRVDQTKVLRKRDFLTHWRFFYDPPEFQTVMVGDADDQFHIGYYRDSPDELPSIVCSNSAAKSCQFHTVGDNIFAPLHSALKKVEKKSSDNADLTKLIAQLEKVAEQKGYSLDATTKNIAKRKRKVVCTPFHGIGLVVPFENNIGYREISETNTNLRRMFNAIAEATEPSVREKKMESLQELITFVQFANDECDPGMGLELGLDLFSCGHVCFHQQIFNLLSVAYMLLGRSEFGEILEAHLANRRSGVDLSNF